MKPHGLEATEHLNTDKVLTGNEGIDIGVWTPPGEPERPTLPGCEHQPNLPKLEEY